MRVDNVRALTESEIALATKLAAALPNAAELIRSLASRRGSNACTCGCASFRVNPAGARCGELGQLAAEAAARDSRGDEHMVLFFACARDIHEVEIVPPRDNVDGFLPDPADLIWIAPA